MNTSSITYNLDCCLNPKEKARFQNWNTHYTQLSQEEMERLAKIFQFKKERVHKLINHKNKKFNFIKKSGYEIVKHFHQEPVETMNIMDPRQPINEMRHNRIH